MFVRTRCLSMTEIPDGNKNIFYVLLIDHDTSNEIPENNETISGFWDAIEGQPLELLAF